MNCVWPTLLIGWWYLEQEYSFRDLTLPASSFNSLVLFRPSVLLRLFYGLLTVFILRDFVDITNFNDQIGVWFRQETRYTRRLHCRFSPLPLLMTSVISIYAQYWFQDKNFPLFFFCFLVTHICGEKCSLIGFCSSGILSFLCNHNREEKNEKKTLTTIIIDLMHF